jgi:hypothetical protein
MTAARHALDGLAGALRGDTAAIADWTPILALANEHLLAPALWSALDAAQQAPALPDEVRDYLQGLHALNGERNRVIRRQVLELAAALNGAGIVPVVLKGAVTLFDGPYDDPAARMMRDIDVLVPRASRAAAIDALGRLGYRLARGYGETHHAFGDFARDGDPAAVDLHTELVDPHYVLPAAEVRWRGTLRSIDGIGLVTPSPTDRVLHNFLHAEIHHLGHYYRGEMQVAQAYELTMLARSFGSAIEWRFIERRVQTHRLAASLRAYLVTAQRLFGLDWPLSAPPDALSRLHYLRCTLQAQARLLQWLGVTWGNLRGPLAWHRMQALYGSDGSALARRCRHVAQFLRKKGAWASVARLRRSE